MSRLAVLERTKLNLSDVTVVLAGSNEIEIDLLAQIFVGFGARRLKRTHDALSLRESIVDPSTDLAVIDAMLGLPQALSIVRDLRRTSYESRFAPVMLTSSSPSASMICQGRDSGINYVVAKPLTPQVLFERLAWVVSDQRKFVVSDRYVGPDRRIRSVGPPLGIAGRRSGDLSAHVGEATEANLSQNDIDALLSPSRVA